jgi:hypothetical protein
MGTILTFSDTRYWILDARQRFTQYPASSNQHQVISLAETVIIAKTIEFGMQFLHIALLEVLYG